MKRLLILAIPILLFAIATPISSPDCFGLQSEPGDGGGGGSAYGHWENYGTVTQSVTCVTTVTTINADGSISVSTIIQLKNVYYLLDKCDKGGSECTLGTQRKTYQGGGC
jgi:hypothetical protein